MKGDTLVIDKRDYFLLKSDQNSKKGLDDMRKFKAFPSLSISDVQSGDKHGKHHLKVRKEAI